MLKKDFHKLFFVSEASVSYKVWNRLDNMTCKAFQELTVRFLFETSKLYSCTF